jgi:ABC-type sugar transport system permease subunit
MEQIKMKRVKYDRPAYYLVLPYIIYFTLFIAYPLIFSLVLLFHRWDIVTPMQWVGLKNFERLIHDPLFFRSIVNTLTFLLIHIPLQIIVALGFALILNSKIKFHSFFRTLYFLPVVVSGVVVTILWLQLYSFDSGLLNKLLLTFGLPKIPWIVSPEIAMPSVAIMATWKNVGIYIIMFIVGLRNISPELYESSNMDGASRVQQFFFITLPLLNPTIVVVLVLSTIGGFSLFIEPYVLTGGGPMQSTLSAVLYIYNQAFYFNHMGYAATLGFVFAIVIFAVIMIQKKTVEMEPTV